MEIAPDTNEAAAGGVTIRLDQREVLLLATALERALFIDTPPHLQGATLDFAESLLRALGVSELGTD